MTACRGCGARGLRVVLSLGRTPLANALLDADAADAPEPTFPLELALCEACSLAQLTETVPPESLFREYVYFSSFSDTMLEHARRLTDRLVAQRRLGPQSRVLEVASNDGYLLRNYRRRGIPVLGVEPARNVARVAREEHGIPTVEEFFSEETAERLKADGRADVLHAHNVLAHVPDLGGFLRGVATILADDGVAVIEVPYVRDLVERGEFDTIYHEHVFYFSVTALDAALARAALELFDVERLPIHGGSLRLFARRAGAARAPRPAVERLLAQERTAGLDRAEPYLRFAQRVQRLRRETRAFLEGLRGQGRRLAAYGASAKGTTLLNTYGLGRETFEFAVDRSPHKQGKLLPGSRIPVLPTEALLERMPDDVLLLAWNLADEVLAQQAEYRRRGGRFLVPFPEVGVAGEAR